MSPSHIVCEKKYFCKERKWEEVSYCCEKDTRHMPVTMTMTMAILIYESI